MQLHEGSGGQGRAPQGRRDGSRRGGDPGSVIRSVNVRPEPAATPVRATACRLTNDLVHRRWIGSPGRPQPCRDSPDTASVCLRNRPKPAVACLGLLNHDPRTLPSTGTDLDAVEPKRSCMRTALARTARLARDWGGRRRGTLPSAMNNRPRSPSTRVCSVEDVARYGGGLGGAHVIIGTRDEPGASEPKILPTWMPSSWRRTVP